MRMKKERVPGLLLGMVEGGASVLERRVLRLLERRVVWGRWARVVGAGACVVVMGAACLGVGMLAVRASVAQATAKPVAEMMREGRPAAEAGMEVPQLDAITVKRGAGQGLSFGMGSDVIMAQNMTLMQLVENAFPNMYGNAGQIVGLPDWAKAEQFDVVGKVSGEDAAKLRGLGERRNEMESALMLQVLGRRFGLKAHIERRPGPVYELVVAKGGSKLMAGDAERVWDAKSQKNVPHGYAIGGPGVMTQQGHIVGHATELQSLVNALMRGGGVDRAVVDKTGLTGRYDFILYWTPEGRPMTADSGPSLFTALEDELGLKLVPAKELVPTVVVDRIERPTEN